MKITVNGEIHQISDLQTLAGLLFELGLDARKVAVECNLEIIPKSTYDKVGLAEGDELEIVHFIGGGAPEGSANLEAGDTFKIALFTTLVSMVAISFEYLYND